MQTESHIEKPGWVSDLEHALLLVIGYATGVTWLFVALRLLVGFDAF